MRTLRCCLAFLCASALLYGQAVYGSISGSVTDASGAAVPNAKVTITDTGKGVTYNTTTNESGNYSQGHLIAGTYEVRVEASGFSAYVQKNVQVEVDKVMSVSAQLAVGAVGETVSVNAEAPLLKTERADVSDTVSQKAVQELPVLGRDMSRLYFLVPGVQATGTTAARASRGWSPAPGIADRPSVACRATPPAARAAFAPHPCERHPTCVPPGGATVTVPLVPP